MKKLVMAAALSAVMMVPVMAATTATSTASPVMTPVAVVNVQQILEASPRVQKLNNGLRDKFKPEQTSLEAEQKALEKEMDQFKRDISVMNAADKAKTEAKIKADQDAFVKKAGVFQKKLNAAQQEVMKTVFESMNTVITSVAKKNHVQVVIDSQAVAYRDDSVDISNDVAKAFNSDKN